MTEILHRYLQFYTVFNLHLHNNTFSQLQHHMKLSDYLHNLFDAFANSSVSTEIEEKKEEEPDLLREFEEKLQD